MKIVAAKGAHEKIGFELGYKLAEAIRRNIAWRERDAAARGIDSKSISCFIESYLAISGPSSLQLLKGLSRGSSIPFESVLRFNALQDALCPEECTTFAAVGKATPDGKAVLLKNRDTSGSLENTGQRYYKNRAINVTVALETEDRNVIVGVTNAGSTGLIMGLNKRGVAAASNFGHTAEIRHLPLREKQGISGRPQMLREGLECSTAKEAVDLVLGKLTKAPMKVPGILWFIDAGNIYVIEGSYGQFAVQHVTDGAVTRSNHFLLLDQLNDGQAVSAICRKIRAAELVEQNIGRIDREKLIEFSMDHKNGPNDNSICRHNNNPEESVTVSAAVMEIDSKNPQKSKISIAMGSPCWAWNNEGGSITFQMDEDIEAIPRDFLDGSSYKRFIRADSFEK